MSEEIRTYTGKMLRMYLGVTPKQFKTKSEKIELLYNFDISRYREIPDNNASNFQFNKYEFELLTILFKAIDVFPFKVTPKNIEDTNIRIESRDQNPSEFLQYIRNIVQYIDEISDDYLITYIYASKIYDQTLEWVTARDKLQQSLSNFMQYIDTLDYYQSARRQRELAHRIDEMLFELIEQNTDIADIDTVTKDAIIQKDIFNPENIIKRFEYYNQKPVDSDDLRRYNHETEDTLIDKYIVNLLNDLYKQRKEKKEKIERKYNKAHYKGDAYSRIKNELLELENLRHEDPISSNIKKSWEDNKKKIEYAVYSYSKAEYKNIDFLKKIESIIDDQQRLEKHPIFIKDFSAMRNKLTVLLSSINLNEERLVADGVNPIVIKHFINDLDRVHKIMRKYDLSRKNQESKEYLDTFEALFAEFIKIKTVNNQESVINRQIQDVTSWSMANIVIDDLNNN